MSDEWFKDKKDLVAAANEFLDILRGIFGDKEKSMRNKLVALFCDGFEYGYKEVERESNYYLSQKNHNPFDNILTYISHEMLLIGSGIRIPRYDADITTAIPDKKIGVYEYLKQTARGLGGALGRLSGLVEYVFVNRSFGTALEKESDKMEIILAGIEVHIGDFKNFNQAAKHRLLKRRLAKIISKHSGELTQRQMLILEKLKQLFG